MHSEEIAKRFIQEHKDQSAQQAVVTPYIDLAKILSVDYLALQAENKKLREALEKIVDGEQRSYFGSEKHAWYSFDIAEEALKDKQ